MIEPGDLEHAIALMKRHKAIEATLERARSYGAIARDALAIFPDCEREGRHGAGHRLLRAPHELSQ